MTIIFVTAKLTIHVHLATSNNMYNKTYWVLENLQYTKYNFTSTQKRATWAELHEVLAAVKIE